jgi:predicted nuclease with TOPRIM domain
MNDKTKKPSDRVGAKQNEQKLLLARLRRETRQAARVSKLKAKVDSLTTLVNELAGRVASLELKAISDLLEDEK